MPKLFIVADTATRVPLNAFLEGGLVAKSDKHPIDIKLLLSRDRIIRDVEETVPAVIRVRGVRASGAPLAYFILIDRSYSMDGAKIFQAKQAIIRILDLLKENDVVYVYGFAARVERVVEGITASNREEIARRVLDMKLGMGTNIYRALLETAKEVSRVLREGRVKGARVIMISDGNPTWGPKDPEKILSAAQRIRIAGARGMVIGVGRDYNERILADIAKMLRGHLEHVDNPDKLEKRLAEFIGVSRYISAKNVVVEFKPTPGVNLVAYGHEYYHTPRGTIEIDVGDISYKEVVDIPVDIIVPPQPRGERLIGTLSARYVEVLDTGEEREKTYPPITVKLKAVEPREIAAARVSEEAYTIVEAAKAAMILEEAVKKGVEVDLELVEELSRSTLLLGENELYERTMSLQEMMREKGLEPEAYKELLSIITRVASGRRREEEAREQT